MAKTLEKTRKHIAKKRNGTIDALHSKSRDSKRLHRAQVRDERLEKIAEARRKKDQPLRMWPCVAGYPTLETNG
jgi:translation machinery-associated protein 16